MPRVADLVTSADEAIPARTAVAPRKRVARAALLAGMALLGTSGCQALPASFQPVTREGLAVSNLFNLELALSALLFLLVAGVLGLALVRFRGQPGAVDPPQTAGNRRLEITWTVLPALVLAVMFGLAVWTMRTVDASAPGAMPITVIGHQWWWEFQYPDQHVVTANELHAPAGTPLQLAIQSADVIHSFWVPEFGWMRDAIPGKTNSMSVQVAQPGEFLGACTQYCGTEHAWMRIRVVTEPRDQFDAWLQQQQRPAAAPANATAARGQQVFLQNTCVNCHMIAGTSAQGSVGPDLTHVGSRATLGAGVLANSPENLRDWIHDAQAVKPGALMPNFRDLPDADLQALVTYLEGLQ